MINGTSFPYLQGIPKHTDTAISTSKMVLADALTRLKSRGVGFSKEHRYRPPDYLANDSQP